MVTFYAVMSTEFICTHSIYFSNFCKLVLWMLMTQHVKMGGGHGFFFLLKEFFQKECINDIDFT